MDKRADYSSTRREASTEEACLILVRAVNETACGYRQAREGGGVLVALYLFIAWRDNNQRYCLSRRIQRDVKRRGKTNRFVTDGKG